MIPFKKLHRVLCMRTLPLVLVYATTLAVLYNLPRDASAPPHGTSHQNFSLKSHQISVPEDGLGGSDLAWLVTPQDFFERLQSSADHAPCRRLRAMGGSSCARVTDGHKQLCLDEDVFLDPRNCTVYSFGVADEITFDTAMSRYGCQVFLLDPTLPPDAYKHLGPKMKFYPYGIYADNKVVPMNLTTYGDWQGSINVTLLTYDRVQRRLGHLVPPDYLKLDVEGAEWHVLAHMLDRHLLAGVKQVAVELHVDPSMFSRPEVTDYLRRLWTTLERLRDQGLQRVYYEPTRSYESLYTVPGTNVSFNTCGELFLIRKNDTKLNL